MESLTVMIPAYNEEEHIEVELKKVSSYLHEKGIDYRIIVVNDGSQDQTSDIVKAFSQKNNQVRLINHESNQGVGTAIFTGLTNIETDWAFLHPADGQFDINEFGDFWSKKQDFDIIVGYKRDGHKELHRQIISGIYLGLTNLLFKLYLKNLNWVTLYRMDSLKSLRFYMRSPIISTEILVKAKRNGAQVTEIPTEVLDRQGGKATAARIGQIFKSVMELFKLRMMVWKEYL